MATKKSGSEETSPRHRSGASKSKVKLPKGYYEPTPLAGESEWNPSTPRKDGPSVTGDAGTSDSNVLQPGKAPSRPKRPKALGYFHKDK